MKKVLKLLKELFFGNDSFVIKLADDILNAAEALLSTIFKVNVDREYYEDQNFEIIDKTDVKATNAERIIIFL